MKRPLKRDGNSIVFDDGTSVDVYDMAKDWAAMQNVLYGDECLVLDCERDAEHDASLFGRHVGRLCRSHLAWSRATFQRASTQVGD